MKKIIIAILMVAAQPVLAVMANNSGNKRQLKTMFELLKKEDNYACEITITSELEGDKKAQKDTVHMTNYQSRQGWVMFTRSDNDLFFASKKGQFRVNKKRKTAYYTVFENDSVATEVIKTYSNPQLVGLIDSFFLGKATSVDRRQEKAGIHFVLKYPDESSIKEMHLVYNTRDAAFVSISYTYERVLPDGHAKMLQRIQMNHYRHEMPAEVSLLIANTADLHGYLLTTYKGYTIKAI